MLITAHVISASVWQVAAPAAGAAAQISSYSFVFPGADGRASRYLLPLLDLINHDGASPAVRIEQVVAAGVFQATALRNISAGEQVTHRCVRD